MVEKSLDRKLRNIHADPHRAKDFIIADAKDADMAFGIGAPGQSPERHASGEVRFRTLAQYREQIREVIAQGIVDIVLMSASTNELLTIQENRFENSALTPAARANDTTDVHVLRGGIIHREPSCPFRSASIDHIQCGHLDCKPEERVRGANLGLYSMTFNNKLELDYHSLMEFKAFREEAERKGFKYFLEIFDPNMPNALDPNLQPQFINDLIARSLAGVTSAGRPVFLKMVYHGPRAMEELVSYDPHLVPGILGGSAGTTLDAFQLIHDAQKYGARAALFGRKINNAEHQLGFIQFLRHITDGVVTPVEAVKAYHGMLQQLGIPPHRSLQDDLVLQSAAMSYGGDGKTTVTVAAAIEGKKPAAVASAGNAAAPPDFSKMTSAERAAYDRERLRRRYGS